MSSIVMPVPRGDANAGRILYGLIAVFSVFGVLYAESRFLVPADAAATAQKILSGELLYRAGIASFLAGQVCQIFLGLALYRLFESVDRRWATTLLALVVAMVPIAFFNALNRFAPLLLLKDAGLVQAFAPAQREALVMLFFGLQRYGTLIAGVFWGLWLLPLGLLVMRSGWFPRVIGILELVGCAGYLVDSLVAFVLPDASRVVTPIANVAATIGEGPFMLWFIIRGARPPRSARQ